jgi:hypothetical protein
MVKKNTKDIEEEENKEEFSVSGDALLGKVKELLKDGSARKILIKNSDGVTLLEFPLTAGVAVGTIGVVFMPIFVAIGAIAAVLTKCTIVVIKK